MIAYNKTLQVTFDPLPIFAAAKAVIGSNAPERGRWADWTAVRDPLSWQDFMKRFLDNARFIV